VEGDTQDTGSPFSEEEGRRVCVRGYWEKWRLVLRCKANKYKTFELFKMKKKKKNLSHPNGSEEQKVEN
jgi:hypothetical protein